MLSRKLRRPLKLILVGSGPDQGKLAAQAKARGIADQVSFPGAMPARRAFALGRTLVVPSRAESLPYIVLEAAGAQIPMVATDVGGINEIACDNAALLAASMQQTIEMDPALRHQQAEDLARFVETRFSISIMADSVLTG